MGYTEKTITSLGLIIAGILGIVVAIFVLSPAPTVSALALTPGESGPSGSSYLDLRFTQPQV